MDTKQQETLAKSWSEYLGMSDIFFYNVYILKIYYVAQKIAEVLTNFLKQKTNTITESKAPMALSTPTIRNVYHDDSGTEIE